MEDLQQKIIELMDLFDEGEVTTADKIDRPQRALDREAIDDFMKRNPMAGGGMLVQPSVDGSRPGYSSDKYSKLMNTSVEDLKKLGFTGVKGTKKGNPGGYYKLTEEFKNWVRKKTQEDPTYGKKELKDQPGRKRVYDLIIKAVKNKNPGYLLEKGAQNKTNTTFKEFDYLIIEKIKNDPLVRKQFKEYSGLKQNQINKIFKDREKLKIKQQSSRGELNQLNRPDLTAKRKFYEKAEKWILRNSKTYVDPENFYNAFVKKFGKDNHLVQAIEGKLTTITDATRKNKRGMVKPNFSDDFMTEVLGQTATKKGQRASVPIENLKDLFRTTIYTNNPVVRQRILDTFTDIIPERLPGKSGLLEIRERLLTDPILKKYNLNGAIRGPIAKLLANDLNQITLEDIASFKRPVVGTTDILRFLATRVDPKYKSMFEEATKAIAYAQQKQWPLAKKSINLSQVIQFDHKIPISLINEGFADDIDYIKVTPASKKFNSEIKRDMFDVPLKRLAREFKLETTTLDRKAEIFEEMKSLRDVFNKKYGNYLDSIKINFNKKTGDIKFTNVDKPVTKKTDLVSSLGKSMTQAGEINKNQLVKLMGSIAATENSECEVDLKSLVQRKADGGRIGFKFGTGKPGCDKLAKQIVQKTIKGEGTPQQRSIVNKLIKGGANFLKDAVDPVELLKLRNYVGPQALGFFAAYEAGVITDDVLRMGKPLNEAVASNWLTKSFLPYTEEFAKQENLLKSGTLTGEQRLFALDAMKYNKLLKEVERIEGMEATQLTDQGGYGMIDGKPMVSQAEIDKAMANVTRVAETIAPSVLDPRSAKAIENKAKMDEMIATRRAKKNFSSIFGSPKLENRAENVESGDYLPDPLKIDLSPITYKNAEDFKPVTELPANRRIALENLLLPKDKYKPMDRSLSNFKYKDSDNPFNTILDDELEKYNRSQRFKEAFQQPGILGANEKFATGGRAGFKVGDTVRKGVLSLIDDSVKKTPKDTTSALDKLIKKTLDEDLFDKKDQIIDSINISETKKRRNYPYNQQVFEEPKNLDFYDAITKSNFRTKTGPYFDRIRRLKKAGGGLLKQAGDRSGAMLESMNPDSQGLQGILNRVKKI